MATGSFDGLMNPEPQQPQNPNAKSPFPQPLGLPVGPLPLPETLDNLQPVGLWGWGMSVRYSTDMGRRCDPVAAPFGAAPQVFYRTHTGRTWKIISAVGVGLGTENPPMPALCTASDENNGNDVPMAWDAVLFTPKNFIDGQQARGVLIVLVFALQQVINLTEDSLDFGASPFDSTPASDNLLNPSDFYEYLDPASPVKKFVGAPIKF